MKKILFNLMLICSTTLIAQKNPIPEIKKSLAYLSHKDGYSGVVLIAKDNEILLEEVCGYANLGFKVPNNMETKFNFASMGKMFTATAIMQLKEKGLLSLEDKVGKILPEYPNESVRKSVTVHQLLNHTSGLMDFFNEKFERTAKHTVRNLEDYLSFFKDDSLMFQPGTKFGYRNAGYIVLGMIIEKLSGQNYYDYAKEHIFFPLEMYNTDNYLTDSSIENMAEGYVNMDKNNIWRTNVYMKGARGSSAGGGYTTAYDLLKFANALKNNTLISKESLAMMLSDNQNNGYGFGFSLNKFNEEQVYGHNGGAQGVSAEMDIYRKSGYVAITLSNRGALDGWVEVRTIIRQAIAGPTDETNRYLGTIDLISIYNDKGFNEAYKKMKEMDGNVSDRLLSHVADRYRDTEQYGKAIDLLKLLVANSPESWFPISILADVYKDAGQKELAIENYKESLKLNPENGWAKERLAEFAKN